jgi:Skp family chaperone for outer membrane proteins
MKKIIVATLLTGVLIACGKSEKKEISTTPKVEVRDMKGLKITYYNSDSLKVYFDFLKKEEAIVTKKQKVFQSEVQRRTKEYQSYIIRNNEKLQNGLLSENEQVQIQQNAQRMEGELMQYQQNEGARLENETMKKLEAISKKIESLGKKFCEQNNIDIMLINGPGGQINYINGSMDVTKEFAAFLNQNQAEIDKDLKK